MASDKPFKQAMEYSDPFGDPRASPMSPIFRELTWTRSESTLDLSQGPKRKLPRKYFRFSHSAVADDADLAVRRAKWGVTWTFPFQMVGLYALGLGGALAHHLYNNNLEGQPVDAQEWAQRLGNALAFFAKMCMVGCVGFAYRQRIWHVFRRKHVSIGAIDAMFTACQNPMSLLHPEVIWKAKTATMLAIFSWSIPLSAIFSPGTLMIGQQQIGANSTCSDVAALDFYREVVYDFRVDFDYSLAFYNIRTDGNVAYQGPSNALRRTELLALLSNTGLIQSRSPCETGHNCSYQLQYYGPAYKCDELTADEKGAPVSFSDIAPAGDYLYKVDNDVDEDTNGRPDNGWHSTKSSEPDYGAFSAEPILWVGYATNTSKPSDQDPRWHHVLESHVMKCVHYNASYKTWITFENSVMDVESSTVDYVAPLVDSGETMYPTNPVYKAFAGYHALGYLFRQQLVGYIMRENDSTIAISETEATQTSILNDPHSNMPVGAFNETLQDLYGNIVLSLLSNPDFTSVVNTTTECIRSRTLQVWVYMPMYLLLGYGLSLLAATIALALGFHSFRKNGICSDVNFSSILVTTRNRTLDLLAEGCCLGQNPLPPELIGTQLRFGEAGEALDGQLAHAAFGTPDEIAPIVVGRNYA